MHDCVNAGLGERGAKRGEGDGGAALPYQWEAEGERRGEGGKDLVPRPADSGQGGEGE